MPFTWNFHQKDDQAALTEALTVKKQCKCIFHGNEWMNES